jgi:hypothetical protein
VDIEANAARKITTDAAGSTPLARETLVGRFGHGGWVRDQEGCRSTMTLTDSNVRDPGPLGLCLLPLPSLVTVFLFPSPAAPAVHRSIDIMPTKAAKKTKGGKDTTPDGKAPPAPTVTTRSQRVSKPSAPIKEQCMLLSILSTHTIYNRHGSEEQGRRGAGNSY